MDKNEQMAKSILKAVGGTENIKAATPCMTPIAFRGVRIS